MNSRIFPVAVCILVSNWATSIGCAPDYCGGPDGWVPFGEHKCYKVIRSYVVGNEGNQLCQEEPGDTEYGSTIATIKSGAEQAFVSNYLFNVSGLRASTWIGLVRNESSNQFVWSDGTELTYSNWVTGSPTEHEGKTCVEIVSEHSRFQNGQWRDVFCDKGLFVLCEKLQVRSLTELQRGLDDLRRKTAEEIERLERALEEANTALSIFSQSTNSQLQTLQKNPVPIGFIYTQLPTQSEPRSIWANTEWQDISSTLAGRFFRVVGGSSAAFGTHQSDNSPRITGFSSVEGSYSCVTGSTNLDYGVAKSSTLNTGDNAHSGMTRCLSFNLAGNGEVRPVNTAVKIWKRIA